MIKKLLVITFLILICCISCASKSNEKPPVASSSENKPVESIPNEPVETGEVILSPTSLENGMDASEIEDAHKLIPPYPDAVLDETKGSISETLTGKHWNLVYYTPDSIDDVANFFRKNIAEDYLTEIGDPELKEWIHFTYKVEGIKHGGKILLRDTREGTTEIVYVITRETSQ